MSRTVKASAAGALLSAALLCSGVAQAASPPAVFVRVEGAGATLLPQTLVNTTTGRQIRGNECPGTSAAGALNAGTEGNWSGSYDAKFKDFLIGSILGESPSGNDYWTLWINGRSSSTGACSTPLHSGDHELWFDCQSDPVTFNCRNNPLALKLPAVVRVGQVVSGSVVQLDGAGHEKPVGGAAVSGNRVAAVSSATGAIRFVARRTGVIDLQARESGATPSDPVQLCAYRKRRAECAVRGPAVHIAGIREHQVFRAGPRRLHGTAGPDPAGLTDVSFSLRRRARSGGCSFFDAGRGRWHATACSGKLTSYSIGASATWSYLLPAPLGPGRYRLVVRATDGNGVRSSSAVDFRVSK
jgi:hypothetical protein